ncbi:MAG TPA: hypothetical protein VFP43_10190 [Mesorhizobium sp.]|nr:hypothetical protein [Mesorhizobium sp.]
MEDMTAVFSGRPPGTRINGHAANRIAQHRFRRGISWLAGAALRMAAVSRAVAMLMSVIGVVHRGL